ncbi:MAG: signal peptidase II [Butyrivibrio sp.]|jgi:signal peptidase II|nr:signal peptidase II [Butyrivibrio sp.]
MKNIGYLMTIPAIFAADEKLKQMSEEKEFPADEDDQCPVVFRNYHNTGAMLNLGAGRAFVKILSTVFTLAVTIYFVATLGHRGQKLLKTGLSLILGGAYSNMYDRYRKGYVVDYISFRCRWKWLSGIVFNIGDFAIMIGAFMAVMATDLSE